MPPPPCCARETSSAAYYRNFPAALEAYGSLVFNYPRAAEVPRALMRNAEIHLLQFLDAAAAAADLERIRKEFPRFEADGRGAVPPRAGVRRGGGDERQNAVLAELVEKYPHSSRAAEGRWMLAYALLGQRRYAEADREFRKLLYLSTDRGSAVRARWGMAQSLEGRGISRPRSSSTRRCGATRDNPAYVAEKIERLKARLRKP